MGFRVSGVEGSFRVSSGFRVSGVWGFRVQLGFRVSGVEGSFRVSLGFRVLGFNWGLGFQGWRVVLGLR